MPRKTIEPESGRLHLYPPWVVFMLEFFTLPAAAFVHAVVGACLPVRSSSEYPPE